jgi:hypothetical protein
MALNAAQQRMLETATKDLQMAQEGKFGDASAAVAAKKKAEIDTLLNGANNYTGTGSCYDEAIRSSSSKSYSSSSHSETSVVTQIDPLEEGLSNGNIVDMGGTYKVYRRDGSWVSVGKVNIRDYIDSSGYFVGKSTITSGFSSAYDSIISSVGGSGSGLGAGTIVALIFAGIMLLKR